MNAFIGQTKQPTGEELAAALGPVKSVWDQLLAGLAEEHGADIHEWKSYSEKWGWSLRVKRKGRTVVWLGPSKGAFTAAFILGDKALQAARETKLPQRVVAAIKSAKKYPEGTGVRLQIKSHTDIPSLRKLAAIKLAH